MSEVLAYSRNPPSSGSFCPGWYGLYSLGSAIAYGSGMSDTRAKYDIRRYENRAEIFLHELIHLDLAADSVNDCPNSKVYDLSIRFKTSGRWVKAYGAEKAKILARYQPTNLVLHQTGYFVKRNDDNLVYFALSNYVASKIGTYPYGPVIYDQILDAPRIPIARSSLDPYLLFTDNGDNHPSLDNITPN